MDRENEQVTWQSLKNDPTNLQKKPTSQIKTILGYLKKPNHQIDKDVKAYNSMS